MMEEASKADLFAAPKSNYTKALIASMPSVSQSQSRLPVIARDGEGVIELDGRNLMSLGVADMRAARRDIALVFQNPYGSLNPRQTVCDLIAAPLDIHEGGRGRETVVARLLDAVGLPRSSISRYPHEFSGGQRQRIAIARALALNPRLLICDEAVSALDVSVQAQVLNLLQDLQDEFALTYLFISHDMSVVRHVSDTIAVMQKGRIVETGPAGKVFAHPEAEYTRTLLSAVPRIGSRQPAALETRRCRLFQLLLFFSGLDFSRLWSSSSSSRHLYFRSCISCRAIPCFYFWGRKAIRHPMPSRRCAISLASTSRFFRNMSNG